MQKATGDDSDDSEIDAALSRIKQKDQDEVPVAQVQHTDDLQKAEAVQTQIKMYNTVLHQRILMQKLVQDGNKLPGEDMMDQF